MSANPSNDRAAEYKAATIAGGSVVELVAVLSVLVFVLCAAAALLLVKPQAAEPQARPRAVLVNTAGAATPGERPFHERFPVNATSDSVDPPTF